MNVEVETKSYDARLLGKPWIAKVSFETLGGRFDWGNWVGDPGQEGLLVIEAEPGDIIATGQKDKAGAPRPPKFFQLTEDGNLDAVTSRAAAFRLWKQRYMSPALR